MIHRRLLLLLVCSCILATCLHAQESGAGDDRTLSERLRAAINRLTADTTMRHASISLYVINASTGAVVFADNAELGLAPASCQKLFTSVAALDLLGPDFRYKTLLGYDGRREGGALQGNLYLIGSGDPTLGSWRYDSTRENVVIDHWIRALVHSGVSSFTGNIIVDDSIGGTQPIPRGWISEDIGNYYGAGAWGLNWHENQYDLHIKPGAGVGDTVTIVKPADGLGIRQWVNECRTGAAGSGDNVFIYSEPYSPIAFVRGTAPLQNREFVVSGSIPDPPIYCGIALGEELKKQGLAGGMNRILRGPAPHQCTLIDTFCSPRLDSINYWFLRKSINLYGEAFVKTLAVEKAGAIGTDKGVEVVRNFWIAHGIDGGSIHIQDGSGLSPQNRVTTRALVTVLQYARTRPWFNVFYRALPEFNGMRMKSGAIGGARSFAGYQSSKDGNTYVFSIIVNNFGGTPGVVIKKMYAVLDLLKG